MRIGFFFQNNKQGGLDTFLIHLLQNWPNQDKFILFCNSSHPGLDHLHQSLPKTVTIFPYNFLIAQDIDYRFRYWPHLFRFVFKGLFWIFGFSYQQIVIKNILRKSDLDRLMVINGGYPAGDACLAATIDWYKIKKEKPAYLNFHNFASPLPVSAIRRQKDCWIDKRIARATKGFIAVSQACKDSLVIRPNLQRVNKKFIYNGLNTFKTMVETNLYEELSLPAKSQILLMLAVYEPRKGHAFIIQVMERVAQDIPQAHLLICGYGSADEVRQVVKLKQRSSVSEKIHLLGHRNDVGNILAQTKITVVPSQAYESFGYTAAEAMYCRVPVVATDVGGLPEVVNDGVCGYIVGHQDVNGFARRVVELLKDKELRKRMGKQGRRRYEQHFTADRMAREYAELIRS